MSNCDHIYLAFAFTRSGFVQCNIVNNDAIGSPFIWHDICYILVWFLSHVDPILDRRGIKWCFYLKVNFFYCAIFAIIQILLVASIVEQVIILLHCLNISGIHKHRVVLLQSDLVRTSPCAFSSHWPVWKKCYRWHLKDEYFNNSTTVSSNVRRGWLSPSRKCQENPKAVTSSVTLDQWQNYLFSRSYYCSP